MNHTLLSFSTILIFLSFPISFPLSIFTSYSFPLLPCIIPIPAVSPASSESVIIYEFKGQNSNLLGLHFYTPLFSVLHAVT